jgi:hypothetical protein
MLLQDKTRQYQDGRTKVSTNPIHAKPLSQRHSSYRLQLLPMEKYIRSLIEE